jgi:hypothetical protein
LETGLMGWFRAKNNEHPDYTGLQIQTSTSTLPIAIVWGQSKVAANLIWYTNFQTQGPSGGKGGLFGGSSQTGYTFTADLIMALCEGPISGLGIIWRDQSTYTLAELGLTLFDGATPQSEWTYLEDTYPTQALTYQGTAYCCAASYQLGDSADIGNHNFEVIGILAGTGVNGIDADPAQVIDDFLTNPQYGAGFAAGSINATTLYGSGGDASLQTYCKAMGIAFSPALTDQEQGSSILARWLQILNCGAVWSGGELKFIPYGDTTISSGNVTKTEQFTTPTPVQASSGTTPPPQIVVCPAARFSSDGGVTYAFTGVALSSVGSGLPNQGQYRVDPAGTYIFAGQDEQQVMNITFTSAIPVSYVPDLTPLYSLTDLDFIDEKGNKDPVHVSRVDPFSLATIQRIECLSRGNQYGATPVEARDQSQIELYGPRVGSTVQAHEICDDVTIGPIVAQTILQRGLYVRANFTFKLSWEYGLLDPMDVVTITDANLGLSDYPVRITTIEEDDKGLLTVTAEELIVGVSTPAFYPSSGLAPPFQPNQAVGVDSINAPLIYEPPTAASGGTPQVWVGASGGSGGVADPNWGGAFVWLSVDNATFIQIATITQPLKQGALTANLASASGWDTTDTLAVTVVESGAELTGTSKAFAQQGQTLCLVDSELLAFENATLSGSYAYNLTDLARGIYGTTGASHSSDAAFYRLDNAVVEYTLPANYVGVKLYFKFQSFNVFGAGLEALSSSSVYAYTPTGAGVSDPIAQQLLSGFPVNLGSVTATPAAVFDNFGSVTAAVTQTINLGTTP